MDKIAGFDGRSLIFYKPKAEIVTPENIKTSLLMSSTLNSPVDTLFYLIHNVYSPVLQYQQMQSTKSDAFDAKLSNTLADLETNLKVAIRRSETDESNKRSTLSPLDEFQYWADMSERGKDKERALFFYNEFKQLIPLYKSIETKPLPDLCEVIEATQDSYDYVWQQADHDPPYSQERMINLLEITSMTLLKCILNKLAKLRPFEDNFNDVKDQLKHSIIVCERWIECCHNLTRRIWRSCPRNRWENDEFVPTSIVRYCKRLNEVTKKHFIEFIISH